MSVTPNKAFFLILIFFCGLSLSFSGFCSGSGSSSADSEREEFLRKFAKDPTVVKAAPAVTATPEIVPTAKNPQENLQNIIQNFRQGAVTVRPEKSASSKSSKNSVEAEELDQEEEGQAQGTVDVKALQQLQGLMGSGNGNISPAELLKKMQASGMAVPGATPAAGGDYSLLVYQMLHPFRAQSEAEVTKVFQQKMELGVAGILFKTVPFATKIPNLLARVARDEKALPAIVKIVNQRGKLTQYAVFVLVTFIISFILKRLKQKRDDSIFSGMKSGIMRGLFMTGLRISVFFVLFSAEFTPLWQVIKTFF